MLLVAPINKITPLVLIKNGSKLISPDVYLTTSVILESACTFCLPNVNNNKMWFIPIYTGYAISFYFFPKCLTKYTLSTAYTLWSGFGVLFTFMLDIILKREVLKIKKLLGIGILILGISLVK